MDILARARAVVDVESAALLKVRDALDGGFVRCVEIMLRSLKAGRKIVVTGVGKNLHVAEKISATLASTGSTSVVLNPTQALHGDLGILSDGDALLVLSYSGSSDELMALIPVVKRLGIMIVTFTGDPASPLATLSHAVVNVRVEREACPFNMAPTASTTATLAVGDALAMVLLDATGFEMKDYARLHPAGAIGRALLMRIADIMRTGARLASVPGTATVRDAVVAMTAARSGSTGVIDANGRLLGIFTDGDLRRLVTADSAVLTTPVQHVMTPHPITVHPEQLAVEALRVFEEHAIDDLLVVDASQHLVGAVDIQDLPKFKII